MPKKGFTTKEITYVAIFVAIGVIVNSMRMGFLSFGGFPIILSGYALGPFLGFIVGGVTDVVAFIVRPSPLGFNPAFMLTSALTGAIPVMVSRILGDRYPNYRLWTIFIGILIGQTITSVVMVPLFMSYFFGKHSLSVYVLRALKKQIPSIPLYAVVLKGVIDPLTKAVDFRKI